MSRDKAEVARHLILEFLDVRRKEFDHLSTFSADHMIVMFVIVMMLVVGFIVTKTNLAGEPGFSEELESAVNCRQTNGFVQFTYEKVKAFACKMLFGAEKSLQYQVTLARSAKPGGLQMAQKYGPFDLKFILLLDQIHPFFNYPDFTISILISLL